LNADFTHGFKSELNRPYCAAAFCFVSGPRNCSNLNTVTINERVNDIRRIIVTSESSQFQPRKIMRWLGRFFIATCVLGLVSGGIYYVPTLVLKAPVKGYLTHKVLRGDLRVTLTEQGVLTSTDNTEIKCKVRGRNTVTWVIPSGSMVEKGDVLVRLDTKIIEESLSLQKTNVFEATATLAETETNLASINLSIAAYESGNFLERLNNKQTQVVIAESNYASAKKLYGHSKLLFRRGFVTELELESNAFTVTQADLELKVRKTELFVLKEYTKALELEEMRGNLDATESKIAADQAGLQMDIARRNRASVELENCIIVAPKSGLVIYPRAAAWKDTPDVAEGVAVSHDQVLLIMPVLETMQVQIGIHEAVIDEIRLGLPATITLPNHVLEAKVSDVASIAKPMGAWSANVVKYDTIIELPQTAGLKPGMSAGVEILIATHKDALSVPVSSVVDTSAGPFCWISTSNGPKKQQVILGDSNDIFVVVVQGIKAGDQIFLHPLSDIEEAQDDVGKFLSQVIPTDSDVITWTQSPESNIGGSIQ
jgi:HlyD family secretion protein